MKSISSINPALIAEAHKIARLEFAAQSSSSRSDEFRQQAQLLSANLAREHWQSIQGVEFSSFVEGRIYSILIQKDGSYKLSDLPF